MTGWVEQYWHPVSGRAGAAHSPESHMLSRPASPSKSQHSILFVYPVQCQAAVMASENNFQNISSSLSINFFGNLFGVAFSEFFPDIGETTL